MPSMHREYNKYKKYLNMEYMFYYVWVFMRKWQDLFMQILEICYLQLQILKCKYCIRMLKLGRSLTSYRHLKDRPPHKWRACPEHSTKGNVCSRQRLTAAHSIWSYNRAPDLGCVGSGPRINRVHTRVKLKHPPCLHCSTHTHTCQQARRQCIYIRNIDAMMQWMEGLGIRN